MPRRAPFLVYLGEYEKKLVNRSAHTQDQYPRTLKSIWWTAVEEGIIRRSRSPRTWTREEIALLVRRRDYRLDGRPKANQSVRHERQILRKFLRFCGNPNMDAMMEWGELPMPPDTVVNVHWLSLEQVVALRVMAKDEDHGDPVALITLQIGLDLLPRASEMAGLTLQDVSGEMVTIRRGKGRKDRRVAMTLRTRLDIEEFINGPRAAVPNSHVSDRLLIYSRSPRLPPEPYNAKSLSEKLRELGRRCDPPILVNAHTLRRTGGQLAYMASPTDQTVRDLQDALGHKTMEQTRRYIGAGIVDQQRTFQKRDEWYRQLYPEEFGQAGARR